MITPLDLGNRKMQNISTGWEDPAPLGGDLNNDHPLRLSSPIGVPFLRIDGTPLTCWGWSSLLGMNGSHRSCAKYNLPDSLRFRFPAPCAWILRASRSEDVPQDELLKNDEAALEVAHFFCPFCIFARCTLSTSKQMKTISITTAFGVDEKDDIQPRAAAGADIASRIFCKASLSSSGLSLSVASTINC